LRSSTRYDGDSDFSFVWIEVETTDLRKNMQSFRISFFVDFTQKTSQEKRAGDLINFMVWKLEFLVSFHTAWCIVHSNLFYIYAKDILQILC
jgi:hypothetical protein